MDIRFTYILFIIFCNIFSAIYTLNTGKYNGDFNNIFSKLDNYTLLTILFLNIFIYLFFYFIYIYFEKRTRYKNIKINKKVYWFMFICLLFQIIISDKFNIGKVGIINNGLLNVIFTRIPIKQGIFILYCIERKNKDKCFLFWPLIVIFLLFNFMNGWSSPIFVVFLLEIFLFYPKLNIKLIKITLLGTFLLPILQFFKLKIRYVNTNFNIFDSFFIFIGRMSNFANIATIYELKEPFVKKIDLLIGKFHYIRELSFAFIPARLQGIDNLVTISGLLFLRLKEPLNNDYSKVPVAFMPGFLGKSILLFNYSKIDFIVFIFIYVLLIYLLIKLSKFFHPDIKYYIFCIWMNFITESFLNMQSIIYYALIFWLIIFKILK